VTRLPNQPIARAKSGIEAKREPKGLEAPMIEDTLESSEVIVKTAPRAAEMASKKGGKKGGAKKGGAKKGGAKKGGAKKGGKKGGKRGAKKHAAPAAAPAHHEEE
jgi:hypothetical protein